MERPDCEVERILYYVEYPHQLPAMKELIERAFEAGVDYGRDSCHSAIQSKFPHFEEWWKDGTQSEV